MRDLKGALEQVGETVTDDRVLMMISVADPHNTGLIPFSTFKNLILEKRANERCSDETELLDAFVAMGGDADGDGAINAEKLIDTIRNEFAMTINIEELIEEIDEDGSGKIELDEFTALLTQAEGDGNYFCT